MINLSDILKTWPDLCGSILLTQNPAGLGKLINFGQRISEGDKSEFGHVAILSDKPGIIYESVSTIRESKIKKYAGNKICIMRHKNMNIAAYENGMLEVKDNLGQLYPAHRLLVHGLDMLGSWFVRAITFNRYKPQIGIRKLMPLDWPVCSELGAQFMISSGLDSGLLSSGWRGVNPDNFDDARQNRPDLWETRYCGVLIE